MVWLTSTVSDTQEVCSGEEPDKLVDHHVVCFTFDDLAGPAVEGAASLDGALMLSPSMRPS